MTDCMFERLAAISAAAASGREIFLDTARRRGWAAEASPSGGLAVRIAVPAPRKEVCHYCGNNPNPRQGHDCGMCGGN